MISTSAQYEDLKEMLFDEVIGVGVHRKVGVYNLDKRLVVKCAFECPNINVLEEEIWRMVKETGIAKWFAPCMDISPCGIFLIQERVERKPKNEYPRYVPSFFGDCKYSNYGWIGEKFVCCDYAGFIITSMVHKWGGKLKKANWWE
ncbi:MAG: hypothetical protein AABY22_06670 [Nanoarchaeota archaeon]